MRAIHRYLFLAMLAAVMGLPLATGARASTVDLMDQIYNQPMTQAELDAIGAQFPEYQVVNPAFLNTTYGASLYFYEDAAVSFTFISEGASYKNSVGYFLYDAGGNILSTQMIFSNASAVGSGGSLVAGDTVDLGTFAAGTYLGFYLISNGYNNPNGPVYYSETYLNGDNSEHFALWLDSANERLVYGVEDIVGPGLGDRDYNDLVFTVDVTPFSATNQGGGGSGTPEPATMVLLASAGGMALALRRRR